MGMRYGSLSVAASLNLYQALVRSVLEYGAEVWTNEEWEEGERVQREMGRRILRCHGKTTNEAVLGELGWWRLQARRDFLKLKYWIKLSLMNDSRLVRQVYLMSRDAYVNMRKKNWCSGIHALAAKYNLRELWRNENLIKQPALLAPQELTTVGLRKYWEGVIWQRIQGVEEQEWKRAMESKPKLRTYVTFKKKLELERYLLSEKEKVGRYLLTRLRVGTNRLQIETGRWKRELKRNCVVNVIPIRSRMKYILRSNVLDTIT